MSLLHCRKRALEPENGGTLCSKVKKIECNSDCCTDEVTAFGGSSVMLWGGASSSLEKQGLSSCDTILMQRDVKNRFWNQWQPHMTKVTSKMTVLTPTMQEFIGDQLRIWE